MSKGVPTNIEPYFDELKYWNYGDNPAFKKFMKIGMENTRGKQIVDHRTHILSRGVRYPPPYSVWAWPVTSMTSFNATFAPTPSCGPSRSGL